MNDYLTTEFPKDFGDSPADFLKRYEHLIYKILREKAGNNPDLDLEDMFCDFFIHISEKNFKRLRQYKGRSKPITYIGKILRNFICDQYRKVSAKKRVSVISLEEISEGKQLHAAGQDQEEYLSSSQKSRMICEALKETFSVLSNTDKLIFTYTYLEGETQGRNKVKEISGILGVKTRYIYDTNRKIRIIFKKKLKEKGINTF